MKGNLKNLVTLEDFISFEIKSTDAIKGGDDPTENGVIGNEDIADG